MTRLFRSLTRLLSRREVVVTHYKVRKTDLEEQRRKTTARLARELGKPNPLGGA
ncbi:hypothetical protein [Aquamicrobium zhengzhouense]|uniref:Uncharacterized protein n=1 Tax=Aquamicrobium zhengzhouense TaxID=2781738 RepID=A0ABS0SAN0_9HYPH|nr:hypothetical protein [Aquamicrobium zhengzhouense]MBI1620316.1 hypothetical protein [Aquamicrobium zhengzhouense]